MGAIFGISDLPVSTIGSAIQIGGEIKLPEPEWKEIGTINRNLEHSPQTDKFILQQKIHHHSNPIIKMRNGFGKLMKHFSKVRH